LTFGFAAFFSAAGFFAAVFFGVLAFLGLAASFFLGLDYFSDLQRRRLQPSLRNQQLIQNTAKWLVKQLLH
jgi:hypothetical protein